MKFHACLFFAVVCSIYPQHALPKPVSSAIAQHLAMAAVYENGLQTPRARALLDEARQEASRQAQPNAEDLVAIALAESRWSLLADHPAKAADLAAEAKKKLASGSHAEQAVSVEISAIEAAVASRQWQDMQTRLSTLRARCISSKLNDSRLKVELLQAEWLLGQKQHAAARRLVGKVLAQAYDSNRIEIKLAALRQLADIDLSDSRLSQAQRGFGRLLHAAASVKHARMQFIARAKLTKVLIKRGLLAEALQQAEQNLAFAKLHDAPLQHALALSNLGIALRELSKLEVAEPYLAEAARRYGELDLPIREADMRIDLGIIQRRRGEYAQALAQYRQAMKVFEMASDWEGAGNAANNIGAVYEDLGRFEEAIAIFERSIEYRRRYGDRWNEGVALANIASEYMALQQPAKAIAQAQQALTIAREVEDGVGIGLALAIIGDAKLRLGHPDQSLPLLDEAVHTLHSSGDVSLEESALRTKAEALLESGDVAAADQTLLLALRYSESIGEAGSIWRGNDLLMRIRAAQDRPTEAIVYGKRAIRIVEKLRGGAATLGSESRRTLRADVRPSYERMAELLLKQHRLAEAEQVMQLLKQDEYQDYIANPQLLKGMQLTLSIDEARWMNELDAVFTRLGTADQSAPAGGGSTPQQVQLIEQLQALRVRMALDLSAHTTPRFAVDDEQRLQFNQVASTSAARTATLRTLLVGPRIHLLLTTPAGRWHVQSTTPRAEVIQDTLSYRKLLTSAEHNPLPLAQKLYTSVLGPIASELARQQITHLQLAPDGALRYLPYAALHDGQQWLAQRFAISLLVSGASAHERTAPPVLRMTAYGSTQASKGAVALPNVATELNTLVADKNPNALFEGSLHLDQAFTKESLLTGLADTQFSLAHLATHFKISSVSEADSSLLLGDGTSLSLTNLREAVLDLQHLRLFSLSACETAVDIPGADGREIEGLATAVLNKGSQAVLATLWPVEDGSTGVFMRQLYRRIKAGQPGWAALQESQLDFLDNRIPAQDRSTLRGTLRGNGNLAGYRDFQHPFFWAAFSWMDRGQ